MDPIPFWKQAYIVVLPRGFADIYIYIPASKISPYNPKYSQLDLNPGYSLNGRFRSIQFVDNRIMIIFHKRNGNWVKLFDKFIGVMFCTNIFCWIKIKIVPQNTIVTFFEST